MTQKLNNFLLVTLLCIGTAYLASCSKDIPLAKFKKIAGHDEYARSISVGLSIDFNKAVKGATPEVRLFEKHNPAKSYPVNIEIDKNNQNNFFITAVNLPVGEYRMIADVPYQSSFLGFDTGFRIKPIVHDFVVHASLAVNCFNFDDKKDDVMGWSSSHVFAAGQDQPVSADTCPGLFFVNTSWPAKLDQKTEGGSLFVPVSNECFPKTSNQMSKDPHWTFSVKSPDLTTLKDWQKLKSINLRVASSSIPVKIAPEVHYLFGDKKVGTHSNVDEKKIMDLSGEGWNTIEYPLQLPESAIITGIELHFYGVPEQTVGVEVNSIYIDGVCPKK